MRATGAVALLVARTRDIVSAQDLLSEAFAAALEQWPAQGVPANPGGWLVTVAKRRHVDMLRRGQVRMKGEPHLQLLASQIDAAWSSSEELPDRRLALMFACAHPLIELGARAPLILQSVLGIGAKAIASAFLVSPGSMNQRLVRAKAHIKERDIPFSVPHHNDMPKRLNAVLEALYAEARRAARRDPQGCYVPIDLQDVLLWDQGQIARAENLLHACNRSGPTGRFQLEAAI